MTEPAPSAPTPQVLAVCRDAGHAFSKPVQAEIRLIEGLGVEGDAHAGTTVQHLSRVRRDPTTPNLRQVHLIQSELFEEAAARGFTVAPGDLGENVSTAGLDLLALPTGTVLRLGNDGASVQVTGLRNPCRQINTFQPGLLKVVVARPDGVATDSEVSLGSTGGAESIDGQPVVRKAGVMAVVLSGGAVRPGDPIAVDLPPQPHTPLAPV